MKRGKPSSSSTGNPPSGPRVGQAKIFFRPEDEAHLSGRCRSEGEMGGSSGEPALVDSDQSSVGREGLLLLGSLLGGWGGGSHGNSLSTECRDLHRLCTAAKRKTSWNSGCSPLGQPTEEKRLRSSLTTPDAEGWWPYAAYSPDFNADEASGTGTGRGHGQRMPGNSSLSQD